MLYIPSGWLVVEIAGNCPLIYGFRKGFFSFNATLVKKYEEAIEIMTELQDKKIERVKKILEVLKLQGKPAPSA